jgi:hypothetical protein
MRWEWFSPLNQKTLKKQVMTLETKIQLEALKVRIAIHSDMIHYKRWKDTDSPHMHEIYVEQLNKYKEEYLETLREVLVPNKTYVMDLHNGILPYDEENNIVPFLYDNMVYGEYNTTWDKYHFDISTPFAINKYCDAGNGSMEENKSEIIECLYISQWTFLVDDDGNTIINGRPDNDYWDTGKINVISNKNIFDTDLIANISLCSI